MSFSCCFHVVFMLFSCCFHVVFVLFSSCFFHSFYLSFFKKQDVCYFSLFFSRNLHFRICALLRIAQLRKWRWLYVFCSLSSRFVSVYILFHVIFYLSFFKKQDVCYFSLFLAEISIFVFVRCFASPNSENGGGYMFFVCYHLGLSLFIFSFTLFSVIFMFFSFPSFSFPSFSFSLHFSFFCIFHFTKFLNVNSSLLPKTKSKMKIIRFIC